MKISCIIPARMGSTRFPGKPMAKIRGRELVLRVADNASQASCVDEVIVATEDEIIQDLCVKNGYECRKTGAFPTCTHRVSEIARKLKCDVVVNLQSDEPLLKSSLIEDVIEHHIRNENRMTQVVYPVLPMDIQDPDCVKCIINNGHIIYLTRYPDTKVNLFGIAGLYVYDIDVICNFNTFDLAVVEAVGGLDTFAFIGKVNVSPYFLKVRPLAVDRPADLLEIEKCL